MPRSPFPPAALLARATAQEHRFAGESVADGVRWPRGLRLVPRGAPSFDLPIRTPRVRARLADSLQTLLVGAR